MTKGRKIAYFDCFSGVSGDMVLGALVDAGLPFGQLQEGLARLGLEGYTLAQQAEKQHGLTGTKVHVHLTEDHDHGHEHAHDHGHEHAHDHGHEHAHDHGHEHAHDHG
ncbi:MAG: LarC family nickel insertion protein, partial [Chloroflexi bacterium]|nr:LarC family nickel insertion protein [Chloroflexota bacterium]